MLIKCARTIKMWRLRTAQRKLARGAFYAWAEPWDEGAKSFSSRANATGGLLDVPSLLPRLLFVSASPFVWCIISFLRWKWKKILHMVFQFSCRGGLYFGIQKLFCAACGCPKTKKKNNDGERTFFCSFGDKVQCWQRRVKALKHDIGLTGWVHACDVRTQTFASHFAHA